jgi:hypothetical protein
MCFISYYNLINNIYFYSVFNNFKIVWCLANKTDKAYKWCGRSHKLTGKAEMSIQNSMCTAVKSKQKISIHVLCKLNVFSICCPAQKTTIFDWVPNIPQKTTFNFCIRSSCSILHVVQCYRHWQNVNLTFHEAPQEMFEEDQIWKSGRPTCCLLRPNHRTENCQCKNVFTSLLMTGDSPSWLLGLPSSRCGIKPQLHHTIVHNSRNAFNCGLRTCTSP